MLARGSLAALSKTGLYFASFRTSAVVPKTSRVLDLIIAVLSEMTRVIDLMTAVLSEMTRVIDSITAVLSKMTRVIDLITAGACQKVCVWVKN